MNLYDWIPAVSTSSALGVALWLCRRLILTRLKASVEYEFNHKLEEIRAGHRKSEEQFKADLRGKETQIEALRSGVISGMVSRQVAVDKRRIAAVDQLWSAVMLFGAAKWVSGVMACVKFEAAAKKAAKDPKARALFASMGELPDLKKLDLSAADKARPFVSQTAWALYSAYRAILSVAVMRMYMLQEGIEDEGLIDENAIRKVITLALPHQADTIEKFGVGACHHLLDELEARLLEELTRLLEGGEANIRSLEQAAKILEESQRVISSLSKPTAAQAAQISS